MAKKRTGNNTQAAYKLEERRIKNKRARLERHLKRFPDDAVAKKALANVGDSAHRKAPRRKHGWDQSDSRAPTWGDKLFAQQTAKIRKALRVN